MQSNFMSVSLKSNSFIYFTSIALSKNDFADLVCGNTDFAADFDFSNFNQIIDVIREIVKI